MSAPSPTPDAEGLNCNRSSVMCMRDHAIALPQRDHVVRMDVDPVQGCSPNVADLMGDPAKVSYGVKNGCRKRTQWQVPDGNLLQLFQQRNLSCFAIAIEKRRAHRLVSKPLCCECNVHGVLQQYDHGLRTLPQRESMLYVDNVQGSRNGQRRQKGLCQGSPHLRRPTFPVQIEAVIHRTPPEHASACTSGLYQHRSVE
ncbi:hypothetical protein IP90_00995 [Luteimonas cucumeris]|uniref:Uncharacterized protein n=1 Tax=Luteimonas cucumeris TaxID=985012 RepID=A0A562LBC8_9GAMM|nr:hypothetical protein IP90_00995 [Luteimonas cucumeris]